ncbi:MAG: hypothetical protein M3Q91_17150 [Acidobacteriota bacterium]|nr:hypothetical protein [Acidobacteriota bacterium]
MAVLLVGVGSGQLMAQQTLAREACGALLPFAALQQLIIAGLLPAECVGIPATTPALNASIRTNVADHFIIASQNNTYVLAACQDG